MKDEEGLNFSGPGELSGPEQQTIEALSCLQGAAYRRVGPEWRVPGRLSQETNSGHRVSQPVVSASTPRVQRCPWDARREDVPTLDSPSGGALPARLPRHPILFYYFIWPCQVACVPSIKTLFCPLASAPRKLQLWSFNIKDFKTETGAGRDQKFN